MFMCGQASTIILQYVYPIYLEGDDRIPLGSSIPEMLLCSFRNPLDSLGIGRFLFFISDDVNRVETGGTFARDK